MTQKKFKLGDYIVYDNPHDYWDEGIVIDEGDGSYVEIDNMEGRRRVFWKSEHFKYLSVT